MTKISTKVPTGVAGTVKLRFGGEPHEPVESDEPTPTPDAEESVEPEGRRSGWRRSRTAVAVLALIALVLGALTLRVHHLAGEDQRAVARISSLTPHGEDRAGVAASEMRGAVVSSDAARRAGLLAATGAVEKVLSYDAKTLDDNLASAREVLTGEMLEQYDTTMASIRDKTLSRQTSVEAVVVASSGIVATDEHIKALLFVNQTTDDAKARRPRVDLNRVVVTLRRGAGDWKVTRLTAL